MPVNGISFTACVVALACAVYGFWFDRWSANVWVEFIPHSWAITISALSSIGGIFLLDQKKRISMRLFFAVFMTIFILDIVLSNILGHDWPFYLVLNHPTLALGSLAFVLATSRRDKLESADSLQWVRWWHFMLCLVAAALFRAGRGVDFENLIGITLESDRLQSLFGLAATASLLTLYVQRHLANRRDGVAQHE
jgi:hypothetical protein